MLSTLRHIDINRESKEDSTGWYVPSWMDGYANQGDWSPLSARNSQYDLGPSHESHHQSEVFPPDKEYSRHGFGAMIDESNYKVEYSAPIMKEVLQLQHSKNVAAESMSTLIATTIGEDDQFSREAILIKEKYSEDQRRIAYNRVKLLNLCIEHYDENNPLEQKMKVYDAPDKNSLPINAKDFVPGKTSFKSHNHLETCITYRRFKAEQNGYINTQEMQDSISWSTDNEYQSLFEFLNPLKHPKITIQRLYNAGYTCPRSEQTETLLRLLSLNDELEWSKTEDTNSGMAAHTGPWSYPETTFKPWHVWNAGHTTQGNHMVLSGPMDLNVCHEYDNPLVNRTVQEMILWEGHQKNEKMREDNHPMPPSVFWSIHIKIYSNGENHILSFTPFSKQDHCVVSHIVITQENCIGRITKGILQTERKSENIHHTSLFGTSHVKERQDDSGESHTDTYYQHACLGGKASNEHRRKIKQGRADFEEEQRNEGDSEEAQDDEEQSDYSGESENEIEDTNPGNLEIIPQPEHNVRVEATESLPYYCIGASRGKRWNEGQLAMVHSLVHRESWYKETKDQDEDYILHDPDEDNFMFDSQNKEDAEFPTQYPAVRVVRLSFKNWDVMVSSYIIDYESDVSVEVVTAITGVYYPPHLTRASGSHHVKAIPRNPVIKSKDIADWDNICGDDFFVRLVLDDSSETSIQDTRENRIYFAQDPKKEGRTSSNISMRIFFEMTKNQISLKFHEEWVMGLGFFQNIAARPEIYHEWIHEWKRVVRNNTRFCLANAVPPSGENDEYSYHDYKEGYWYAKDSDKMERFLISAYSEIDDNIQRIPDIERRIASYAKHFCGKKRSSQENTDDAGLSAMLGSGGNENIKLPRAPDYPDTAPRPGETQRDANVRAAKEYEEAFWKMLESHGGRRMIEAEKKKGRKTSAKQTKMARKELVRHVTRPLVEHEEEQMDLKHLGIKNPELHEEILKIQETNELRIPMYRAGVAHVIGYLALRCQISMAARRQFIELIDEWATKYEETVRNIRHAHKEGRAKTSLPKLKTFDEIMSYSAISAPEAMQAWTDWWYSRVLGDMSKTVRFMDAVADKNSETKSLVSLWVVKIPSNMDPSSDDRLTWDDIMEFASPRFKHDKIVHIFQRYRERVRQMYGNDHLVASDDEVQEKCLSTAKNTGMASAPSKSYLQHKQQWDTLQERIKQMEARLSGVGAKSNALVTGC